jgi:HEAT repeat protein
MPTNAENWTSVLNGCAASAGRQLETWISLSEPPDVFDHLMATLQNQSDGQAEFLLEAHIVARALLEPEVLTDTQARELMAVAMVRDSLFDMKLLQRLLAQRAWPSEVPYTEIQRCLYLVEDAPDANRISVTLLKFSRHPDLRVQSKAAKLLGRHLSSLDKIEELYLSPNERVRANLIEGIARRKDIEQFMPLVERGAQDPSNRVSTMALAILARRGHKMSQTLLAMRRRSKVEAISWAANFAHEVLVRPFQADDLGNLAAALHGVSVEPAVVPAVAEVNSEAEAHPDQET